MAVYDDSGALGGRYVKITQAWTPGMVDFTPNVPSTGNYYLWARVQGRSWNENSFYVSIDNAPDLHFEVLPVGDAWVWSWQRVHQVDETAGPIFLAAGAHSLYFRGRKPNCGLDALILTNNPSYKPTDVGPEPTPGITSTWTPTAAGTRTVTVTPTITRTPTATPVTGTPLKRTFQQGVGGYASGQDVQINSWYPDENQNPAPGGTMQIRAKDQMAALIQFDISTIPSNATVTGATLQVVATSLYGANPVTVGAYQMNRAWLDSEATWMHATDSILWLTAGANGVPGDRAELPESERAMEAISAPYQFDVTEMAAAWVRQPDTNHGLALKTFSNGGGIWIASNEHGATSWHPKLTVFYMLPTPSPTPTKTTTASPTPTETLTATLQLTATPSSTSVPAGTATPTMAPQTEAIWLPLLLK